MSGFKIVTDINSDLPDQYLEEHNIGAMFLPYTIDGVTYHEDSQLEWQVFYEKMRSGMMPKTSQVNPTEARNYLDHYLEETTQLLCIMFSSGLSGTYNSVRMAAQDIMEERDDCNIIVIDSKCASLGEGLLVHKAVELQKKGCSMEEIATWLEENILHLVHLFTVDDLNHLYRGGRVSRTAAVVGTMANIKPILHVDDEGHLIPISKIHGRKKSLHALADYMEKKMGSYQESNDIVFISHGDALEEAEFLANEIKNRFGIKDVLINQISPTIGAHSGPGTIALFFMGEIR